MHDQYTLIPLSSIRNRKNSGTTAKIDTDDLPLVAGYKWQAVRNGNLLYAVTELADGTTVQMHRVILGVTDSNIIVDHADRNPLNNTRSNLRTATRQQNAFNAGPPKNNTSGYKGVSRAFGKRWRAYINVSRKQISLGTFDTREEAALAYDSAALEMHGEFACLNFPKDPPTTP